MILAFDTYYTDNKAKTVCLSFESWANTQVFEIHTEVLEETEEYVSGEFYKRELPCILSLLKKINTEGLEAIIVDGFVFLDDNGKLGLGGHLYHYLEGKVPVIGVAKTNFATLVHNKRALTRGDSKKPLFITAAGTDLDEATTHIKNMPGAFRMPTLLKTLDTLTKDNLPQRTT